MVNDERVSIMYEGDGQNKTFAYPYSFTRKEDIVGYVISNGKTKRISTNFEFNPTTKQYMYPKNGTPLARNESILLTRETPRNNTLQLPNEPIYTALQGQLDKIVRMIQELGSHHKGIPLQVLSEQFDTVIPTQIGNAYLRINRERNAIELVENPFDGVERITSEVTSTKANIDRIKAQIDGIHTESLTMYGEIKEKLSRVDRDTETLKERAKQEIRSTQQTVLQSLEQVESDITRRLKNSDILQSVGAVETKAREIKGYVGTMENSIAELRNIQSSTIATKEEINQLKASVIEKASAAEGHAHNLEQAIEEVKGISNGIQSMQQSILDKNREAESMRDTVNQLLQEYKSYAATIVRDMQGYVSSATSEVQKAKEWANKAGAAKTGNWVTQEEVQGIQNDIKNTIRQELISPIQSIVEEEKRKVGAIENSYLSKADAAETYIKKVTADNVYMTKLEKSELQQKIESIESNVGVVANTVRTTHTNDIQELKTKVTTLENKVPTVRTEDITAIQSKITSLQSSYDTTARWAVDAHKRISSAASVADEANKKSDSNKTKIEELERRVGTSSSESTGSVIHPRYLDSKNSVIERDGNVAHISPDGWCKQFIRIRFSAEESRVNKTKRISLLLPIEGGVKTLKIGRSKIEGPTSGALKVENITGTNLVLKYGGVAEFYESEYFIEIEGMTRLV